MKKVKTYLLCILLGVLGLLVPLFNIVECSSNPVLTMSGITTGEKNRIYKTVNDINSSIFADSNIDSEFMVSIEDVSKKSDATYTLNISFDNKIYSNLDQPQKQKVMSTMLIEIENSDMSQISRSKMYNFIANNDKATSSLVRQLSEDVTADFASAYASLKPFKGVLGWVLGILTLTIFIMLGLTIVIDIGYITTPFFQNLLSSENSNSKPRFISPEAWHSVQEAEKSIGGSYKEPLSIYGKTKTKQFLGMGLCLLYLASGYLFNVIADVIDFFSGFIGG